jgi:hypothetical protein
MRPDRKMILNEIGFAWNDDGAHNKNHEDKRWHLQHEKLLKYKRKNGHCMVSKKYEQDKSLGNWVHTQRKYHNNNTIRLDRKIILDKIGFAWNDDGAHAFKPDDKLWHQQYEKLLKYKRKNGQCLVPKKYEQDKSLGQWVFTQRKAFIKNKLRLDRKDLLEDMGFIWETDGALTFKPDDRLWRQQYEKLLEFKRNKGHCMVPSKYQQDQSLGTWVSHQRSNHKNNNLRPDRKELLDALEFVWRKADSLATHSSAINVRGLAI